MPENDRGIGSEGLEQGGPNLGNDYTRSVGTRGDTGARDAIIVPHTEQRPDDTEDRLNMDNESSRNLTSEYSSSATLDDDTEDDDDDMMEDDELQGLDTDDDDDDDDDDENDII
jgi:hypothetical protein